MRLDRLTIPNSLPSRSTGTRFMRCLSSRFATSASGVDSIADTTLVDIISLTRRPAMRFRKFLGQHRGGRDCLKSSWTPLLRVDLLAAHEIGFTDHPDHRFVIIDDRQRANVMLCKKINDFRD